MYLLGKKVRPKSIIKPLGEQTELPDPLSEPMLMELVQRLRNRLMTPEQRDQLFLGHVRLAIYIAGQYAHQTPHKIPDLIGEAMLALGIAIDEAPDKLKDDNFTPYAAAKVHSRVNRYICEDHVTGIPPTTFADAEKAGKPLKPIKVHSLNISTKIEREDEIEESIRKRRSRVHRHRSLEVRTNIRLRDLKEMISQSVKTAEEQRVVELREAYYNDREIAEKLGVSNSKVASIRTTVERRFVKLEKKEN